MVVRVAALAYKGLLFSLVLFFFPNAAPHQHRQPMLCHAVLSILFAVLATRAALGGHICSYCNGNARLSCAYPDNYACRVSMYNTTIKPCSKMGLGSGPGDVSAPSPSGSSYLCPVSITDGKGNEFSGPATASGASGKPKIYTCDSIQSVKAACTCTGKCNTSSCPSRAPVPVKIFGSTCARPECARECDSTLEKLFSAFKALNSAGQTLVDHVIKRAKPRRRRTLQDEGGIGRDSATISRGQSDDSQVKIGVLGWGGVAGNTQMTEDDARTLTDDVSDLASNAQTALDLVGLENRDPLRNLFENKVPELKPTKSTFFGKFVPVLIGKAISPLAAKFAEVADDVRVSVGDPFGQVKAVHKLLSIQACIWRCILDALKAPDFGGGRINCEKRCS